MFVADLLLDEEGVVSDLHQVRDVGTAQGMEVERVVEASFALDLVECA